MRKVNVFTVLTVLVLILAVAAPAFAAGDTGGVNPVNAGEVSSKLVNVFKDILQPIGALVIFVAIAWTAFKLIVTANKPQERAEAMSAIPYILGGGVALGAVMLLAGFVVGLMSQVGS